MKELDTKQAGRFAVAAILDAQRRNTNNKSLYTEEQLRKALTVRDLLDTAFSYNSLYINYRQKFIAVKVEGARAKDAMSRKIIALFDSLGYSVVTTQQGVIVRLDKTLA